MKTKWVTFDCYGTLIDWESGIRAFFQSLPGVTDADVLLTVWEESLPVQIFKKYPNGCLNMIIRLIFFRINN